MIAVTIMIMMMTIARIADAEIRDDKDSSADHFDAGQEEEGD